MLLKDFFQFQFLQESHFAFCFENQFQPFFKLQQIAIITITSDVDIAEQICYEALFGQLRFVVVVVVSEVLSSGQYCQSGGV